MANFNSSFRKMIPNEGGYANDPDDPGKETYAGISRRYFPNWDGWTTIDNCKLHYKQFNTTLDKYISAQKEIPDKIKSFYYEYFWEKCKLNKLDNQYMADFIFDTAINMGIKTTIRLVQNSYNESTTAKSYLKVDGLIGKKTLQALNTYPFPGSLTNEMVLDRIVHYYNLVETNPKLVKFLKGWLKRTIKFVVTK